MKKAYLLVFSETLGTREEVKNCVDSIPQIIDWRSDLPQAIYLISEESAATLSGLITEKIGKHGRFILQEFTDNSAGWLPKKTWYLLQNKSRMPKGEG
ncbi:MAG: hypothetical protein WAN12_00720 [Candidatus Acidiferrum sp.]